MKRGKRRNKARDIMKNMMKRGVYSPDKCDLPRRERRRLAWKESIAIMRKRDENYERKK